MSPIIATILLVAITVVLAAVLYVLVSGLTRTGASTPYSLGMTATPGGATGTGANWFDSVTLSPTSGLTTSMFGLQIVAASGATLGLAAAVAGTGCTLAASAPYTTYTTGATGCNGPASGWYGVLLTNSNTIAATYTSAGWAYAGGVTTIALNNGYSLTVISSAQLAGNGYTISAYSTSSSSVSGSGTL